jgi:microtubule-associated protein 1 light chain
VIVERFDQELSLPHLQKSKFLVPQELSMSQLITVVR